MNPKWTTETLMAAGVAVAGCNLDLLLDPPRATDAIAFGYLDTSACRLPLQWIELRQYAPFWRAARPDTQVAGGLFYNPYLRPGGYEISRFGGGARRGRFHFTVPGQCEPIRFRVDRSGVHYVGSFRFTPSPASGDAPGGFRLEPIAAPTEPELLRRLVTEVDDPGTSTRLRERLTELN